MRKTRSMSRTAVALVIALTVVGCAGGSGGSGSRGGNASRIVQSELENVPQLTALEAIQRLRPRWLTTRTGAAPMVHVDGNIQMGGAESLRNFRVTDIQEMRYLNAADATTRFGTNYVSGVILITSKR